MASADQLAQRTPHPWRVGVVSGMASYIDSATIIATGIALVIYQETIGVTGQELGIMSGALTLAIAAGALVGGRLGDRFGRRRVFLVTMITIALGAALLTFGVEFPVLFTGILLVGLGTGADLPVSLATIAEAATDKNRGAIIGLSNILWTIGIAASQGVAAVAGGWGRLGGQLLFAHVGIVALILLVARLSIPESPSWLAARDEGRRGVATIRAQKTTLRDALRPPYVLPFVALLAFYALTNLAANTNGQFGTYVSVNLADIPVEVNSRIGLVMMPLSVLAGVLFMRIVGTRWRMPFFAMGGVMMIASYAVPAVFGFSVVTIVLLVFLGGVGGAFAFEGIMKVWSQESFPTMLRSSVQGAIVAVARVFAALLAFVTPALVEASPRGLYLGLAVVTAVGLIVGWVAFHGRDRNEFDVEHQRVDAARPAPASVHVS